MTEDPSDDKNVDNVIDEENCIVQAIKAIGKYTESKINFTSKTKIKSTEMTDTFHIIKKKKEERNFQPFSKNSKLQFIPVLEE